MNLTSPFASYRRGEKYSKFELKMTMNLCANFVYVYCVFSAETSSFSVLYWMPKIYFGKINLESLPLQPPNSCKIRNCDFFFFPTEMYTEGLWMALCFKGLGSLWIHWIWNLVWDQEYNDTTYSPHKYHHSHLVLLSEIYFKINNIDF